MLIYGIGFLSVIKQSIVASFDVFRLSHATPLEDNRNGQLENLDWTMDWTGLESRLDWTFLRGVIFLEGECIIFSCL